ncbi:MAG: YicC/YloC family endoribonuclease [Desulfohalobiaceae bacterium]
MFKSMTGYGAYQEQDDICFQRWEIKSVNSKQLSLRFKAPQYMSPWEPLWEREVRSFASRGRVEAVLTLQITSAEASPLQLDQGGLESMIGQLEEVARKKGHTFVPDYTQIMRLGSLWQETGLPGEADLGERLTRGLRHALRDWDASRSREGEALQGELRQRVGTMQGQLEKLRDITESVPREKLAKLQQRVRDLLPEGTAEMDRDRLPQELALLADKLDVSEELSRLGTHLGALEDLLQQGGEGGRKLDFLLQECFREANTCGNKIQDARASQVVVEVKTELEKCREQAQNLE